MAMPNYYKDHALYNPTMPRSQSWDRLACDFSHSLGLTPLALAVGGQLLPLGVIIRTPSPFVGNQQETLPSLLGKGQVLVYLPTCLEGVHSKMIGPTELLLTCLLF